MRDDMAAKICHFCRRIEHDLHTERDILPQQETHDGGRIPLPPTAAVTEKRPENDYVPEPHHRGTNTRWVGI